ncbi:MAG: hypothetical protein CMD20_05845 [Flavobacteriales bacterium]|nr:hypothetical protein [Flavobacteriales bacterium]|tara:strand:- start:795 stop:1304 length:510 start_codon:yes stop_codon:yes gene_type:complete
MKFFTRLCFITFIISFSNVNAQVLIRNTSTEKSKEIDFGSRIYYKLYSDSILEVEITKDVGILITTSDSSFVLSDGMEIAVSDIKYLEIESKKVKKWRGIMSPFLFAGLGFLTKGVTMAIAEGDESNNETLVPLYTGIGGSVSALSSIPFWLRNKSYDLTTGNYEILIP